jgi:tripartite-type tricarboxylate transporter receptor subunit TctC
MFSKPAHRAARIAATICLSLGAAWPALSFAQGYGVAPAKLIVTNAPGTAPDAIGRGLTDALQKVRGTPFVVENKVGVQGLIGGDYVVRSRPDGTALLLVSETVPTVLTHLPDKLPFDPLKDLKPIAMVADAAYVLVVHPSLKVKTLHELVQLARSKPGALDYASTGVNSAHNRVMVQFLKVAGIRMNQIPYGSTGPLADVVAGVVPIMWSGLAGAIPQIKAGKLVPLAVSGARRHPSLADVPTVDELGYKGFDEVSWFGIMGPATLADSVAATIETDVLKVVRTPEFRERMIAQGMDVRPMPGKAFQQQIASDYARNKDRVVIEGASK